jgi:CHAT domain-containing protein
LEAALETEAQIFASSQTNLLIPPHRRIYENLFSLLSSYSSLKASPELAEFSTWLMYGFLENMRYRSLRNFVIRSREKQVTRVIQSEQERNLLKRIESLKSSSNSTSQGELRKAYSEYEDLTLKIQLAESQYVPIAAAKPIALDELQQTLSLETAIIEFVLSGENVFALVIGKDQAQLVNLPVKKTALIAKTKLFRSLLFNSGGHETEWVPVAESLRELLILPLEESGALVGAKQIGLIPFGVLHDLPFAALVHRENEKLRFLIEDYKLFQTPSATFYAHKTRPILNPTSTTVALGRNGSTSESLPALEHAAAEAQAVAETMKGTALVNLEATESALKRWAPTCDYLHLSTHAIAESDMPLFSRLLMEKTGTDDGNLTVREVFELGLHTKLVTLSACDTGQSYSTSGTDLIEQDRIGLIEAFLHAGSDSVLATLLPISDQPTTEFMKHFYEQLRLKQQSSEALTNTQRAVLRGEITLSVGQRNPKHPRFWAPFFLTGRPD